MKTTFEHKGLTIEIVNDEMAESPDQWGNDDCFIVYDHRQFTVERKGFDPETIFVAMQTKHKLFEGYYFFPVYAYIHSGVSLSLGRNTYPFDCPWDTSFRGFALVKRQKGWTRTSDKAYKVAESLIEEWNTYLSGDVWGYKISNKDGVIESCWGFYGFESCESEAKAVADTIAKQNWKERLNRLKEFIRKRVPYFVRQQKLSILSMAFCMLFSSCSITERHVQYLHHKHYVYNCSGEVVRECNHIK